MKHWAPALIIRALVAATAVATVPADATPAAGPGRGGYANPSAVIAAEAALARQVREKGERAALRAAAAPDALVAAPRLARADRWLKEHAEPAVALAWRPHAVWSSCDGSLAVSRGSWQRGDAAGVFATVWQRQPDGGWKWLFRQRIASAQPLAEPGMLPALVADCPRREPEAAAGRAAPDRGRQPSAPPPLDPVRHEGKARDGSLWWQVTVRPDGLHELAVGWSRDGRAQPLLSETAPGEGA